jgi:hypothetical protein
LNLESGTDIKDLNSEVIKPAAAKNADDFKRDSGFGALTHLQKSMLVG